MQPHTNVIEFPQLDTTDDGPRFYAWRWARGAITVTIMGLDDLTDGETMLTFTPEVGVEMGQSKVLALSGEPTMLHFKGIFADHCATVFSEWNRLADENDRPGIFEEEGLPGLARLPKLAEPPLPPIDEERTALSKEVRRLSGERIEVAGKLKDLTLADCIEIVEAVGSELEMEGGDKSR